MKLLHTSDWHLGQSFMGKSRFDEHKSFLDWLLRCVESQGVDCLVVAGDIFDTTTPPNYALELYYNFLNKLSCICNNIIITAGNHDSIATLKAPKQLLKTLRVDIIASGDEDEDEIVEIYRSKKLVGIVCAVPFLRDYVVRRSVSGESVSERDKSLSAGIKQYYQTTYKKALKLSKGGDIPIIATGHLTTVGSKKSDSEREIYIGGSLDIDSDFFAKDFDYVALGHLHINQKVGLNHIRYSGSPIPLSFSESTSQKKINIVEFDKKKPKVTEVDIPLLRPLLVIRGDIDSIVKELESVEDKRSWIEVHIDDDNPFYANESVRKKAKELELILLAVKIKRTEHSLQTKELDVVSLDELEPIEVFEHRLKKDDIQDVQMRKQLIKSFNEIVVEVKKL